MTDNGGFRWPATAVGYGGRPSGSGGGEGGGVGDGVLGCWDGAEEARRGRPGWSSEQRRRRGVEAVLPAGSWERIRREKERKSKENKEEYSKK